MMNNSVSDFVLTKEAEEKERTDETCYPSPSSSSSSYLSGSTSSSSDTENNVFRRNNDTIERHKSKKSKINHHDNEGTNQPTTKRSILTCSTEIVTTKNLESQQQNHHRHRHRHRPKLEIDLYRCNKPSRGDRDDDDVVVTTDPNHHNTSSNGGGHYCNYEFGDTTYRQDGVTIGSNYMRFDGQTITRNELVPSSLQVQGMIGRGAFSKVHKAIWTTTTKTKTKLRITHGGNTTTTTTTPSSVKNATYDDSSSKSSSILSDAASKPHNSNNIETDNKDGRDDLEDTDHQETNTTLRLEPEDPEPESELELVRVSVAIKQFDLLDVSEQRSTMLQKELRTLCQLSESESLVKFYGAFLQNDSVVMVLEYMNGGSLEQILLKKKRHLRRKRRHNDLLLPTNDDDDKPNVVTECTTTTTTSTMNHNTDPTFFPPNVLVSIAYQVLSGLKFLHDHRVLHRDIKPGNILLNTLDGSVKLCDFGISSLFGDQSLQKTVVGTSRYMSPERLRAREYGRASDVWSFGLVLLECITGEIPWKDCDSIISLVVTVEETNTQDLIPTTVGRDVRDILMASLEQEPNKRMPVGLMLMSPWFLSSSDGGHAASQSRVISLTESRCMLLNAWHELE